MNKNNKNNNENNNKIKNNKFQFYNLNEVVQLIAVKMSVQKPNYWSIPQYVNYITARLKSWIGDFESDNLFLFHGNHTDKEIYHSFID